MTSRSYLPTTWMDTRQDIRPSAIHGMGIFAREPIRQGEVVEIVGGDLMTEAEFWGIPAGCETIQRHAD